MLEETEKTSDATGSTAALVGTEPVGGEDEPGGEDGGDTYILYTLDIRSPMTAEELGASMAEWVEETRWLLDDCVTNAVPAAILMSDIPEAIYSHIRAALSVEMEEHRDVVTQPLDAVREEAEKEKKRVFLPPVWGKAAAAMAYADGLWENLLSIAALTLTIDAISPPPECADGSAGDTGPIWPDPAIDYFCPVD